MAEPRIYNSRWDKARLSFLKSHPLCAMCHRQGRAVAASVVDHIKPHRLKEAINGGKQEDIAKAQKLFWDKANWQPLCKSITIRPNSVKRSADTSSGAMRTGCHSTRSLTGAGGKANSSCKGFIRGKLIPGLTN